MPTFPTPEPIEATVQVVGDVRLTASDRPDTAVVVRPRDPSADHDVRLAEQTLVECAGGKLLVKTPRSWRRFTPFGGHEAVDVAIELPTGSTAAIDTAMGDVTTDGELGASRITSGMGSVRIDQTESLDAKSGFGDVFVDHVVGDARIKTGSGELRVGVVEGAASITNSNGGTRVDDVGGDLQVKAANGSVVVGRARASATAKTACGSITFREVGAGAIVAETAAGSLDVAVRPGVAAWLDVKSGFGSVHSSLTDGGAAPAAGEPTVSIRCRTSAGDITISRAAAAAAEDPR